MNNLFTVKLHCLGKKKKGLILSLQEDKQSLLKCGAGSQTGSGSCDRLVKL